MPASRSAVRKPARIDRGHGPLLHPRANANPDSPVFSVRSVSSVFLPLILRVPGGLGGTTYVPLSHGVPQCQQISKVPALVSPQRGHCQSAEWGAEFS